MAEIELIRKGVIKVDDVIKTWDVVLQPHETDSLCNAPRRRYARLLNLCFVNPCGCYLYSCKVLHWWSKPPIAAFFNMNTKKHSPPPKTLKIGSNFGPRRKRTSQDLFLSLMDSKTFSIQNSCSATFFHKHRSPRIRHISFVIRIFLFRCQHATMTCTT